MSYILEALKKSEQARMLGNVPTLHTMHDPNGAGRSWHSHWAVLLVLVLLGVTGVALYQYRHAWVQLVPLWDTGGQESATSAGEVTKPVTAEPLMPPGETKPTTSPSPEVEQVAASAVQDSLDPVEVAVEPRQDVAATSPPEPQDSPQTLELQQLSPDVRAALPALSVNVVSYSQVRSRRFVMINQVIYKGGQEISEGLLVDEITPDGVVLTYRSNRFLLRP